MTATPTPTPGFQNASSSFASSFDLVGPLVVVLYVIGALLAAQFVAPWLGQSELLARVAGRVVASIQYAIKGIAATAVLVVAALPVYFVVTADGETRGLAGLVIAGGIAAYCTLVGVGWLADRAVTRFIDAHPDYEEWDDIVSADEADDDADPEVAADGGDAR